MRGLLVLCLLCAGCEMRYSSGHPGGAEVQMPAKDQRVPIPSEVYQRTYARAEKKITMDNAEEELARIRADVERDLWGDR